MRALTFVIAITAATWLGWAGCGAPGVQGCPAVGACAVLDVSAPGMGAVTLDRMDVIVHVGQAHRWLSFDDRVLALPLRVPVALPELDQQQGQRVALYLRASYSGPTGPVGLVAVTTQDAAAAVQAQYAVALARPCADPVCMSPDGRQQSAMTADARTRRVVLFGGAADDGAVRDDTWEWDGMAWQQVATAHRPPGRSAHAMAYDPQVGRVMLFGGRDASGHVLGDTWAYLGAGPGWQQVAGPGSSQAGLSPGPRALAAMASVPAGGGVGMVLFGGAGEGGALLGDTWTWHGDTGTWSQVPVVGPCGAPTTAMDRSPRCRAGAGLAPVVWPDGRTQVLLVGGVSGTAPDDTQTFDAHIWGFAGPAGQQAWQQVPVATPPEALNRWQHRLVATAQAARVLLVGGEQDGVLRQDAFMLDLRTGLFQPQLGVVPGGRSGAAVAYDDERGEVVVQGGRGPSGDLQDLWLFGDDWMPYRP